MAGRCSTSWRVSSQEMPPCPTMIPARMTVTGTPADPSSLSTAAAAQVGRQGVGVVAKAAEVDDAAQPGPRARVAERHRGGGILALEVRVAERVDKIVGRLT